MKDNLLAVLDNLYSKQQLQDLLIRAIDLNIPIVGLGEEYMFKKGRLISKESDKNFDVRSVKDQSTINIKHSIKVKMTEQLESYPNVLAAITPQLLLELAVKQLELYLSEEKFSEGCKLAQQILDIELLYLQLESLPEIERSYYISAAFCFYHCENYVKAYKMLRNASTPEDISNWALLGNIVNKYEDSSFYRSYMKRLQKKEEFAELPFLTLILGNNFLQKQQFDLAL